jgi:hypothetical protein
MKNPVISSIPLREHAMPPLFLSSHLAVNRSGDAAGRRFKAKSRLFSDGTTGTFI